MCKINRRNIRSTTVKRIFSTNLSFVCLTKKKQKVKAKRQLQFFSRKRLRNATEKIAVRSVSPKSSRTITNVWVT